MAVLKLGYSDKNKTIKSRIGDSIVISLFENATTGYQWKLKSFTEETVALGTSDAIPAPPGDIGAGGDMVMFRLEAKAAGRGEIKLKLTRGTKMEEEAPEVQFNLEITPANSGLPTP